MTKLTKQTAERIAACFADLATRAQRADSREFAKRHGESIAEQLASGDVVSVDWDAEDRGDAAYLMSCRASYGLRAVAAKLDTGKRRIGTGRG
jgi:hypothetical protein